MAGIIVALPKIEDAKHIRDLLTRSGFHVMAVCTSGAGVLEQLDALDEGIIVTGYKLKDMLYSELYADLPPGFEMLLVASQRFLEEYGMDGIVCLAIPFKVAEIVRVLRMLEGQLAYRRRKMRRPKEKTPEQLATINEAKLTLMKKKGMSEEEAHRYLQKRSMENSTSLVETAEMVLTLMK